MNENKVGVWFSRIKKNEHCDRINLFELKPRKNGVLVYA